MSHVNSVPHPKSISRIQPPLYRAHLLDTRRAVLQFE
jgi:hypothetical protein